MKYITLRSFGIVLNTFVDCTKLTMRFFSQVWEGFGPRDDIKGGLSRFRDEIGIRTVFRGV